MFSCDKQFKSLVSALHHSGTNQVKQFFKDGSFFGWDTLKRLWQRELSRSEKEEMVTIPRLRSSYIYRDSWTRLSVTPAKIMQVSTYAATLGLRLFAGTNFSEFQKYSAFSGYSF